LPCLISSARYSDIRHAKRNDRQGRILVRVTGERRRIGEKQILVIVRPAESVHHPRRYLLQVDQPGAIADFGHSGQGSRQFAGIAHAHERSKRNILPGRLEAAFSRAGTCDPKQVHRLGNTLERMRAQIDVVELPAC
jgi:hypothetical protein